MTRQTQLLPPILLLLTAAFLHLSAAAASNYVDFIRSNCDGALYADTCFSSLSPYANSIQQSYLKLARIAITVSLERSRQTTSSLSKLSRSDSTAASALKYCISNFGDAIDEISYSLKEMRQIDESGSSFGIQIGKVQTWMSSAITHEDTCKDGFEDFGDGALKSEVLGLVGGSKKLVSIAYGMVNRYAEEIQV